MTDEKKTRVTGYFQPGDTPTATHFEEFIDLATNASGIDSGTLGNDYLPPEIEVSSVKASTFTTSAGGTFNGDGSGLTNLSPLNIDGRLGNDKLPEAVAVTSVVATTLEGNGSGLTNLSPLNIDGRLGNDKLPEAVAVTSVAATTLEGNGSGLTNLSPLNIDGRLGNDKLPEAVAVTSVVATTLEATNVTADSFVGDGSSLINLEATAIKTGKVAVDRLPDATTATRGIVRYATAEDIAAQRADRVVSAQSLAELSVDSSSLTGPLSNDQLPETIEGKTFLGDGAGLTALDASQLASGTVSNTLLPEMIDLTQVGLNSSVHAKSLESEILTVNQLSVVESLKLMSDQIVTDISNSIELAENSDSVLATQKALKAYIDAKFSNVSQPAQSSYYYLDAHLSTTHTPVALGAHPIFDVIKSQHTG